MPENTAASTMVWPDFPASGQPTIANSCGRLAATEANSRICHRCRIERASAAASTTATNAVPAIDRPTPIAARPGTAMAPTRPSAATVCDDQRIARTAPTVAIIAAMTSPSHRGTMS